MPRLKSVFHVVVPVRWYAMPVMVPVSEWSKIKIYFVPLVKVPVGGTADLAAVRGIGK